MDKASSQHQIQALGYRLEHAVLRTARLTLAQSYDFLKDQEEKATRILAASYQDLSKWYRLIETRQQERKAYGESLDIRFRLFAAGSITADFLLEPQRRLAAAQVKEYEAVAEYNKTLAKFEWAKGTILQHNNVAIQEGPLPQVAMVRAVEHERERSKALVLRERPEPLRQPGVLAGQVPQDLPEQLEMPPAPANKSGAEQAAPVATRLGLTPKTPEELMPVPAPAEPRRLVPGQLHDLPFRKAESQGSRPAGAPVNRVSAVPVLQPMSAPRIEPNDAQTTGIPDLLLPEENFPIPSGPPLPLTLPIDSPLPR